MHACFFARPLGWAPAPARPPSPTAAPREQVVLAVGYVERVVAAQTLNLALVHAAEGGDAHVHVGDGSEVGAHQQDGVVRVHHSHAPHPAVVARV